MARAVLIVEDEVAIAQLLARTAASAGLDAIMSNSVGSGMTQLEARFNDIAIAFVDVGLPDGNGNQVADALHRLSPAARIIIMSGYLDEASENGHANERLQKPFDFKYIRDVMRAAA